MFLPISSRKETKTWTWCLPGFITHLLIWQRYFYPKCCHDYAILLFLLHFYEAILFYLQADVGQEEDFEAAKKKAAKLGAIKVSLNSINTNRSYNECVHSHWILYY